MTYNPNPDTIPAPVASAAQLLAEHLQKVPVGPMRRIVRHSESILLVADQSAEIESSHAKVRGFLNELVRLREAAATERSIEEFERAVEHATSATGDTRRARLVKVYAEFFERAISAPTVEADA